MIKSGVQNLHYSPGKGLHYKAYPQRWNFWHKGRTPVHLEGTRVIFLSTGLLSLCPIHPPLRPSPHCSSSDRFEHIQALIVAGLSLSLQGSWIPSDSGVVDEQFLWVFFSLTMHLVGS